MMVEVWPYILRFEFPWNVVACVPGVQISCLNSLKFFWSGLLRLVMSRLFGFGQVWGIGLFKGPVMTLTRVLRTRVMKTVLGFMMAFKGLVLM